MSQMIKKDVISSETNSFIFFLFATVIAGFFFFFQVWQYPKDLYFEPVMGGSSAIITWQALQHGTPIVEAIYSPADWKTPATTSYLYQYALSNPLTNALVTISMFIFREPLLAYLIPLAFGGFLASILAYFMGRKFYDSETGFMSSVLVSTSFYYLIHARGVTMQFYSSLALLSALVIFTFYLIHVKRTGMSLVFASIAGVLAWLNGYTQIYVLPAVLLIFMAWHLNWQSLFNLPKKINQKTLVGYFKNFWGKHLLAPYQYIFAALLMFVIFLFSTVLYSSVLKAPSKLEAYRAIPEYNISRLSGMKQSLWTQKDRISNNAYELFNNAFVSGGIGTSPGPQNPPGIPMIYPFVTFFFLIGVFAAFKKHSMVDKILLAWVFTSFFFIIFIFEFQTRYLVSPALGIYLLAARGMVGTGNFLTGFFSARKNWIRPLFLGFFTFLLLFYGYTEFFVAYAYKGSSNKENFGYYDLTMYLEKNADPKNTALIFEDNAYVAPAHIFFHTKGGEYDFIFWKDLQRKGEIGWTFNKNILGEEIAGWEEKTLSQKDRILYLHIKNPYFGSEIQTFKEQFLKFHPEQKAPIAVIDDLNSNPAFEVYEIKK